MMQDVKDKSPVAVVTGGTSGIGRAIAVMLLDKGYRVVTCSRAVSVDYGQRPPECHIPCDIQDKGSVSKTFCEIVGRFERIDLLVNAAGVSMPESSQIGEVPDEYWNAIMMTNVFGMWFCCQEVVPAMKERKSGTIVNILSTAAHRTIGGNAPYSVSKYGARALTETLRQETGEHGIRVFSVSPGPVDTGIWDKKTRIVTREERASMLSPDDIAEIVDFLISRPPHVSIGDIVVTPTII